MIDSIRKNRIFLGLLVCLIIAATIISSYFSRDSVSYNRYIFVYGSHEWGRFFQEIKQLEVLFIVVSKIIYKLGLDYIFVFLIYAAISLSVKFYLIGKHSKDKWLSLSFFISYFFILHDSTQIRFGMAIALAYLGLHYLSENRKLVFALIVIFSAIMLHVVSLIFILMLFFTSKRSLLWLFGMVAVAIALYPVDLNAIALDIVGDMVDQFDLQGTRMNKIYTFLSMPSSDVYLGMFSRSALLVYLCAIVIFQYRSEFSKYEILCFNAFIMSIFFYILLKDTVDLQVRVRDLFGFSLVFLMPFIHRGMSTYVGHRNAYIILYAYLGVHLIKFAIYDKMLIL